MVRQLNITVKGDVDIFIYEQCKLKFKNHFIFEVICLMQIASNRNFGASKFLLLGDRAGAKRRKKVKNRSENIFLQKTVS